MLDLQTVNHFLIKRNRASSQAKIWDDNAFSIPLTFSQALFKVPSIVAKRLRMKLQIVFVVFWWVRMLPSVLAVHSQRFLPLTHLGSSGLGGSAVAGPCEADALYEQLNYICVGRQIRCLLGWQVRVL